MAKNHRLSSVFSIVTAIVMLLFANPATGEPWDQLSPRQRYEAWRNYERYQREPESRRRELEQRYERWQKLPDSEKERIRRNYERWQQLSPHKQEELQRKYDRWKQSETGLPPVTD